MPYYTLAIIDRGVKKYYAGEDGWITDKSEAVWFTDYQNVKNVVFDEGLEMSEVIIEEGSY